jgi:hypothetical protein
MLCLTHKILDRLAWETVAGVRVPFRMVASLLRPKADLVAAGVPENLLEEPDWMRAAAAELKAIKPAISADSAEME